VTLRVVGAGLPRTGTLSLRAALQRLLGGRCYHMEEVFDQLDHVPVWRGAIRGALPDWHVFLADYVATVDWPASAFWKDLAEANPDAVVLLSSRRDPKTWWESVEQTILGATGEPRPGFEDWQKLFHELLESGLDMSKGSRDAEAAMAAYERHNEEVRSSVAPERLVDWRPGDGWAPICRALGLQVPDQPFPHLNTRAEWLSRGEPRLDR
jgi:hypothetical protein